MATNPVFAEGGSLGPAPHATIDPSAFKPRLMELAAATAVKPAERSTPTTWVPQPTIAPWGGSARAIDAGVTVATIQAEKRTRAALCVQRASHFTGRTVELMVPPFKVVGGLAFGDRKDKSYCNDNGRGKTSPQTRPISGFWGWTPLGPPLARGEAVRVDGFRGSRPPWADLTPGYYRGPLRGQSSCRFRTTLGLCHPRAVRADTTADTAVARTRGGTSRTDLALIYIRFAQPV